MKSSISKQEDYKKHSPVSETIKNEFRSENLSLSFETNSQFMKNDPEEVLEYFHSAMWPICKKFKIPYLTYRFGVAIYYTIWFIESIISNVEYRANNFYISSKKNTNILLLHPWPFYMTSWSLTMLFLHLWSSAFIVLYFYSIDKNSCLNSLFSYIFGPFSCTRQQRVDSVPQYSSNTFNKFIRFFSSNKSRTVTIDATDSETPQVENKLLDQNSTPINNKVEFSLDKTNQVNIQLDNVDNTAKNNAKLNKTLCYNQANCRLPSSSAVADADQYKMWYYSHVPRFILYLMKFSWLLYNIIIISAILVTVGYFTHVNLAGLVVESTLFGEVGNFHRHGINSIVALVDLLLMAYPVRILHFVYTAVYGWTYALVIFIYWYQNPQKNVIYDQIDYSKPVQMIGLYTLLTIITFIMQSFHFMAYKLKLFIKDKLCNC